MVTVPSDWVKVPSTWMAPAAEQMLLLSAKALGETFTFIALRWSKMKNHAPLWEVKILDMISTPLLQCSDLIVCNIFSKRFVYRISEQANPSNRMWMYVTWKPQLKWTYHSLKASLKQHLETLPKALQGAPRLLVPLPRNRRWSVCHRTGWRCSRKWHLPPSKCRGFLPKRLGKSSFL